MSSQGGERGSKIANLTYSKKTTQKGAEPFLSTLQNMGVKSLQGVEILSRVKFYIIYYRVDKRG